MPGWFVCSNGFHTSCLLSNSFCLYMTFAHLGFIEDIGKKRRRREFSGHGWKLCWKASSFEQRHWESEEDTSLCVMGQVDSQVCNMGYFPCMGCPYFLHPSTICQWSFWEMGSTHQWHCFWDYRLVPFINLLFFFCLPPPPPTTRFLSAWWALVL